jgi:Right handed beta helix region
MVRAMMGRGVGVSLLCAAVLTVLAAPPARAADPSPCRVRNVTQDTSGRSLIRMVNRAKDGDELRLRGTCRGPIVINDDVVLQGVGARPTVTGLDSMEIVDNLIEIKGRTVVVLRDLTVERGVYGGIGIRPATRVRLVRTVVQDNEDGSGSGGGIDSSGRLVLVASIVRRNHASNEFPRCETIGGGGILQSAGRLILRRSRVVDNSAACQGGGIVAGGALTIIDSVISRNDAVEGGGGGIVAAGPLTVIDSVIRRNVAGGVGGGIAAIGASTEVKLVGSSVTLNSAGTEGGGIWVRTPPDAPTVMIDAASSVTGNTPDDCVGTPAC